eukprot:m.123192 g.123192  ORF g.123192 m.123192 type:complete len:955 (+) comp13748_c0_seq1:228-3092(+)
MMRRFQPHDDIDLLAGGQLGEDSILCEDGYYYSMKSLVLMCEQQGANAIVSPADGETTISPYTQDGSPKPFCARVVEGQREGFLNQAAGADAAVPVLAEDKEADDNQLAARGVVPKVVDPIFALRNIEFSVNRLQLRELERLVEFAIANDDMRARFAKGDMVPITLNLLLNNGLMHLPEVIVLGAENVGKSTLLNRIFGQPVFPHNVQICTLAAVRMRLRRGPRKVSTLRITGIRDGAVDPAFFAQFSDRDKLAFTQNGLDVPLVNMKEEVQRLMNLVLERERQLDCPENPAASGIAIVPKKELVITIQKEELYDIDIVDLPGLRQAVLPQDQGRDIPRQTWELAEQYTSTSVPFQDVIGGRARIIDGDGERVGRGMDALFLLLVDGQSIEVLEQSRAYFFVRTHRLEEATLGVVTKADRVNFAELRYPSEQLLFQEDLDQNFRPLYGWSLITSNHNGAAKAVAEDTLPDGVNEVRTLIEMSRVETAFFNTLYPTPTQAQQAQDARDDLVRASRLRCGISNLQRLIRDAFESHLVTHWFPQVLEVLQFTSHALVYDARILGSPRFEYPGVAVEEFQLLEAYGRNLLNGRSPHLTGSAAQRCAKLARERLYASVEPFAAMLQVAQTYVTECVGHLQEAIAMEDVLLEAEAEALLETECKQQTATIVAEAEQLVANIDAMAADISESVAQEAVRGILLDKGLDGSSEARADVFTFSGNGFNLSRFPELCQYLVRFVQKHVAEQMQVPALRAHAQELINRVIALPYPTITPPIDSSRNYYGPFTVAFGMEASAFRSMLWRHLVIDAPAGDAAMNGWTSALESRQLFETDTTSSRFAQIFRDFVAVQGVCAKLHSDTSQAMQLMDETLRKRQELVPREDYKTALQATRGLCTMRRDIAESATAKTQVLMANIQTAPQTIVRAAEALLPFSFMASLRHESSLETLTIAKQQVDALDTTL